MSQQRPHSSTDSESGAEKNITTDGTDIANQMGSVAAGVNRIQDLITNGFQVGDSIYSNENLENFYYLCFEDGTSASAPAASPVGAIPQILILE